eukprot:SM000175S03303  [mRNA]  locus=s175:142333:148768:- [translate_table: standard]
MMAGVGSGAAPRPHCSQSSGYRALCTFEVGLAEDGVTWKLQRTPPARSVARAHFVAQPIAAPSERDAHWLGLEQPSAAAWDAAKRKLREAKALWHDTYTEDSRHTTSNCHTASTASLSSYNSLRDLQLASSHNQQQDQVLRDDAKRMSTVQVWHGTGTSESPEEVAYQAAKSADDTEACLFGQGKAAGIFKTGSGIPIRVSAAAKRRAHEILQCDEEGEADALHEPLSDFKTGMADANWLQPENAKQQLKSMSMFTSGSGRTIEVSEASLKRARCLLNNADDSDQKEQDVADCILQDSTKDVGRLAVDVQDMTSEAALLYRASDGPNSNPAGHAEMRQSLLLTGALPQLATSDFPRRLGGKYLTKQRVFDELRYRYNREINMGQRPILRKITEKDAPAGCAVHESAVLLLTDGWYQIKGRLDTPLTNLLHRGKIFLGQKLRAYPEACLLLHMNCTYRAHWADKLGLCKQPMRPLALHCVKEDGGVISSTIVTVTRIYPMLYWQRYILFKQSNGQGVMRSEKAEDVARCQHEERRTRIAESTLLTLRKDDDGTDEGHPNDEDSKVTALQHAVPLNASHLLISQELANVKAEKAVREALEIENLGDRDVSHMLRLRISNLGASEHDERCYEGLISIWRPHDEQDFEEGRSYQVCGLLPTAKRGQHDERQPVACFSTIKATRWRVLPSSISHLRSYFEPRKATPLTSLTKSLIGREIDTAAFVIHIGEPILGGTRHTQWLFLVGGLAGSDGSTSLDEACILAVEHSAVPEAFVSLESSLNGSTIACCNLLLSKRDVKNNLWVATASDIGVISGNLLATHFAHLRVEAGYIDNWAKQNSMRVHFVFAVVACFEEESATLNCSNKLITGVSITMLAAHSRSPARTLLHRDVMRAYSAAAAYAVCKQEAPAQ